jgi:hypothetical protein
MKLILSISAYPFLVMLWLVLHIAVLVWLLIRLIFYPSKFNKILIKNEWNELRLLDKMLNPLFFYKK